ncbi:hypothetical protein F5Y00DRAFT_267398 [Daldinia vernicosa]|uniref:uncharacterized protein n=1 Tax=Daldinia vernicosa TaxID=114800 RepID=UPI0020085539|nr:uncharacterized protein F5Y00DRAFT_267398 [Daldinia vernicosa]KAI0854132.1 hypothetical protein F5Y00DRAFT_267398 [Daldinia vernicosa]
MCFVEYVGYTCGHTSVPVMRPCPMTTQMHNNPCCPHPACRPMLPSSMCPACGRILHGRFIDIIEYEHRFMHERGACSCGIRFPHLQQPRMVTRSGSGSGSGYGPTSFGLGEPPAPPIFPATAQIDGSQFSFSPSAAAFTPSADPSPYTPFAQPSTSTTAASINIAAATTTLPTSLANLSITSTPPSDVCSASPEIPPSRQHQRHGKGSKKWKGKGRSGDHHQSFYQNNNRHQRRRASSSGTPRNGNAPGLPPLFEEREHSPSSRRLSVSVRMLSLYGAEWTRDHAELHRAGRCSCDITFDRYTGRSEMREEIAAARSNNNDNNSGSGTPMIQYGPNDARRYANDGESANTSPTYNYDGNTGASTSSYQSPSVSNFAPGFQPPADQATPPYLHISDSVHQYWTPHTTQSAPITPIAPGQPARWACSPYDTSAIYGHGQQPQQQQQQHGYNNAAAASGVPIFPSAISHPIDMQTIYYEPEGTPILGLPVGAGPEGDSHMPPFENCELYYPKLSPEQRPASH